MGRVARRSSAGSGQSYDPQYDDAAAGADSSEPMRRTGGGWTLEEDRMLKEGVKAIGPRNWKRIAHEFLKSRRTDVQCLHRWQKVLRPGLVKGPWTEEEDRVIVECMRQGISKWSDIASRIPGRLGKQCRERWVNHLDPSIKKGAWSQEEDERLVQLHTQFGNKWKLISQHMEGRSENAVKNRWNSRRKRRRSRGNERGGEGEGDGTPLSGGGLAGFPAKRSRHPPSTYDLPSAGGAHDGPKLLPPAVAGGTLGATAAPRRRRRRDRVERNRANPLDLSHLDDYDISLGPPDLVLEPVEVRGGRRSAVARAIDSLAALPWHELEGVGPARHASAADEEPTGLGALAQPAVAEATGEPAAAAAGGGAKAGRRTRAAAARAEAEAAAAAAAASAVSASTAPSRLSSGQPLDLRVSTFSELVHDVLGVPLPETLPTIEELQTELRTTQQHHAAQLAVLAARHAAYVHHHHHHHPGHEDAHYPPYPSHDQGGSLGFFHDVLSAGGAGGAAAAAAAAGPNTGGLGSHATGAGLAAYASQSEEGSRGAAEEDASVADAAASALQAAARAMAGM